MNTKRLNTHSLNYFRPKSLLTFLTLAVGIPTYGLAGDLTISNNALEVVTGVEPNIMIVTDDSSSMDMSILTNEEGSSGGWLWMTDNSGTVIQGYAYAHPAPGASGLPPAINLYGYFNSTAPYTDISWFNLPSQDYFSTIGLGDKGIWRGRNSDYNKVYYNPNVTYEPWEGVDSSGAAFADASSTAARYNPYNSADGTTDLTATINFHTACPLVSSECQAAATATLNSGGTPVLYIINVTGFYPARYYEWTDDSGGSANGIVDAGDSYNLVEIKTGQTYSGRQAYSVSSGTGRSDCGADVGDGTVTCTYDQEIQNFANWFSYYRKRDLTTKAAIGAGVKPAESARIGYATINSRVRGDTGRNIGVASMNISPASGNKKDLLDKVYGSVPATSSGGQQATPLRQALVDTGEYYACNANNIFGTGASSPGDANCPVEAAPAGQCQQNYTLLMTDGYWDNAHGDSANKGAAVEPAGPPKCNGFTMPCFDGGTAVGDTDNDNDTDYDGGAFGDSVDSEGNTLADIAMEYYEDDLHGGLTDEVPTTTIDIERYRGSTDPFETMHQHMTTYTVAFGVNTSLTAGPTDVDAAFDWTSVVARTNTTIDDLAHAAINGRGRYLDAANPVEMVTAMKSIFNDIETSTGTATAVAFNTQEVEAGTLVFRASFNTKTNKGDLVAQRVNPDGTVDADILWSAARMLDSKVSSNSDTRTIITYQDTGATSVGTPFQWSGLTTTASTGQQALLDAPQPANIPAGTNTFGDERVGYLRGHDQHEGPSGDDGEFRSRAAIAGKLGDIVHSTPVFVGKPPFLGRNTSAYPPITSAGVYVSGTPYSDFKDAQASRTELTYVGANDGMLHAFDTSDGSELFAYIPNILIDDLPELTDPAYAHRFYVDSRPSINDVYITPARGTNASTLSWNTVLIGGLGAGGKGYYALNITSPSDFANESTAKTNVMWEFTEADDGGVGSSDLGFSFSEPLIAMTNSDDGSGNKEWWAFFGNGYNSTSADGDSALYMLKLEGGQDGIWTSGSDFRKITTGFGKAESADGTTPNGISGIRGIDTDSNGTVDYIYAGDLQGNLFRFDMTNTSSGSWGTQKLLFQAKYSTDPAERDATGTGTKQPITSRPIVIKHPSEVGYIVIAATGSWMTTGDATSTDIQSIYGLWDDMSTGTATTADVTMVDADNQLVEQVFTNHSNLEHGYTVRSLTNNEVAYDNNGNASNKTKGWFIDLDVPVAGGGAVEYPGERAVRNLQIRGDILFVNTIIPRSTNACTVGAGGFELAFNPVTGGSGETIIFDVDGNNSFDDSDNIGDNTGESNIITGIRFDTDTPTDSAFIGNRRMTQEGDDIRSFATNTDTGLGTGRTSWREIVD